MTEKQNVANKTPFFYGWVIWIVGAIGMMATGPGQSYSVSLFIDKLINDLSISRLEISNYYGIGTLIASFTLTWVGKQIDKHGNRKIGVIVTILFSIALILFSKVNGVISLIIGFIAIRGLGQGSLSMVSSTAIALWFRKKRGRVISYAIILLFIFQSVYIPWLQKTIDQYGWRQAWIILGGLIAVTILPIFFIFMRNKPEDFNLLPDGVDANGNGAENEIEENWKLKEVQKTPLFWIFLFARIAPAAFGTGLIFHQISLFNQMGHSPTIVTAIYARTALVTAAVAIFAGYMIDNWKPGKIIVLQLSSLGLAMGVAMFMRPMWTLTLYAIFMGFMHGSGSSFDAAVWANLFGRKYLGEIRGFVSTILAAGTAIGPVFFGFSFDNFDGYGPVLVFGILWCVLASFASLAVKNPVKSTVY